GHNIGVKLASFQNIQSPGGSLVNAVQDPVDGPPKTSNLVLIAPEVIPVVSLLPKITYGTDGYPAYALLDSSGNVVRDSLGRAQADLNSANNIIIGGVRLIDLDGDSTADNYDFNGDTKRMEVDFDGDGIADLDLDGDGLLDVDFNKDGIPDAVEAAGSTSQIFLVTLEGIKVPLNDQGFADTAWAGKTSEVYAQWQKLTDMQEYFAALGRDYSSPENVRPFESSGLENWKTLGGLALPTSKVTRTDAMTTTSDNKLAVDSTAGFPEQGYVYVGSEIMYVKKTDGSNIQFDIISTGQTGSTGRGERGSVAMTHLKDTVVSDQAFLVSVRGLSSDGGVIVPSKKGRPIIMYRVDPTPPSVPGAPEVQQGASVGGGAGSTSLKSYKAQIGAMGYSRPLAAAGSFNVTWIPSTDEESGVQHYEVQEALDNSPVWRTIALIPAVRSGGAINNVYIVGNPDTPGDTARELGHYYSYRVRAFNAAGVPSDWSQTAAPAATGEISEVVTKVSNYPNPVDIRKGGYTTITYVLGADSSVKITVYDLLGYKVQEWVYNAGDPAGGKAGPNFIKWFGDNASGTKVSKGGYIVKIEVNSSKGSQTIIRKVGIIH
ncbi:MAG: hypothetical protein AABZ44_07035, partial [Elusimicrobiota bacterium]